MTFSCVLDIFSENQHLSLLFQGKQKSQTVHQDGVQTEEEEKPLSYKVSNVQILRGNFQENPAENDNSTNPQVSATVRSLIPPDLTAIRTASIEMSSSGRTEEGKLKIGLIMLVRETNEQTLRAHLHMAKNLSTNSWRILDEEFFFSGAEFVI